MEVKHNLGTDDEPEVPGTANEQVYWWAPTDGADGRRA